MSNKMIMNRDRIRKYIKASPLDYLTIKKLDDLFVRCDKQRTGQIPKQKFLGKLAKY